MDKRKPFTDAKNRKRFLRMIYFRVALIFRFVLCYNRGGGFMIPIIALSALASIFSLHVHAGLRVTLGAVFLIVGLERCKKLPVFLTTFFTGLAVVFLRIVAQVVFDKFSFADVFNYSVNYSIEILFYLGYAFFYYIIVRKNSATYKSPLVPLLIICDFGGNAIEYAARYFLLRPELETITFPVILAIAVIRSVLIWIMLKYFFETRND